MVKRLLGAVKDGMRNRRGEIKEKESERKQTESSTRSPLKPAKIEPFLPRYGSNGPAGSGHARAPGAPWWTNERCLLRILSAGVNLGPDDAHDLLLDLGLLGVDVGVSHLAVLIHKEEPRADVVGHRAHPNVPVLLQVLRCYYFTESNAV